MQKNISTIFVEETDSTNELAKEILKSKTHSLPFSVQANLQTKGKGQFSKTWESKAKKNLLLSLVVEAPRIEIDKQFEISKAVAVAIRNMIKDITDAKVCIKWPNDIYVGDEKIAGVLIENTIIGRKLDTCIIGIGLNVNQIRFSDNLPNPTSLALITNKTFSLENIKDEIINAIIYNLKYLKDIDKNYTKFLYRKGELGKFISDKNLEFLGVITGVDITGKLCVRTENNVVKTFSNNEIKFVLPQTN